MLARGVITTAGGWSLGFTWEHTWGVMYVSEHFQQGLRHET